MDEVDLRLETTDFRLRETIEKALFSTAIGADLIDLDTKTDQMTTYGRRFVSLACAMGPLDARDAAKEALRLYRLIEKAVFAAGYDALISPTVATTRIQRRLRSNDRCADHRRQERRSLRGLVPDFTVQSAQLDASCDGPNGGRREQCANRPADSLPAL